MITIARETPLSPELTELHARHRAAMHAESPPESIHMLPADALAAPGISFFVMREDGAVIGMGAYKRHSPELAEIKSMHVLSELRGRGLARRLLDHLVAEARAEGAVRLSLETGTQDAFGPARMLYEKAGFAECPPFADYRLDPYSVFYTREI